jgi:serine/threonine protein kinase
MEHLNFEYQDGTEESFSESFEYRASIGSGGFGFVIAALDKSTGEEIAIKMLKTD